MKVSEEELFNNYIKSPDWKTEKALIQALNVRIQNAVYKRLKYDYEDVVNEVFYEVLKRKTPVEKGKFLPWVYEIAKAKAIDEYRKRQAEKIGKEKYLHNLNEKNHCIDNSVERDAVIREAFAKIPSRFNKLAAKIFEGKVLSEIETKQKRELRALLRKFLGSK